MENEKDYIFEQYKEAYTLAKEINAENSKRIEKLDVKARVLLAFFSLFIGITTIYAKWFIENSSFELWIQVSIVINLSLIFLLSIFGLFNNFKSIRFKDIAVIDLDDKYIPSLSYDSGNISGFYAYLIGVFTQHYQLNVNNINDKVALLDRSFKVANLIILLIITLFCFSIIQYLKQFIGVC